MRALWALPLLAIFPAAAGFAQEAEPKLPTLSLSIAEVGLASPEQEGPLFKVVIGALREVPGGAPAFIAELPEAGASLTIMTPTGGGVDEIPVTSELLGAIRESCLEPFFVDEGSNWTQFSWVCKVASDTPLNQFFQFQNSPEISMVVWFNGDRIKNATGLEVLRIPLARRLPMDAYDRMRVQN